jgi:hypothetical protein
MKKRIIVFFSNGYGVRPWSCFTRNRFNNKWWLFGSAGNKCYLYFSDDLLGNWEEHPQSPIVSDNTSDIHYYEDASLRARPGGRAFVFDHDHVIRLVQANPTREEDGKKIWRVRAFEVTLTETEYSETEIHEGADFCEHKGVFCESGSGWNAYGMHHFDAWWSRDHWLIATDGMLEGAREISVGIFRSPPPGGVPDEPFMEREHEIREDIR